MVREIQCTPTHIDYCDIAVSFSVRPQSNVLSTKCVNEVKRKSGFSKQTWKERVCVCVCWVLSLGFFNQGVTLSVPIRYSRQGSPAGCFWTTPSKKQIMLPHSDSKKINSSPSFLSLPPPHHAAHLRSMLQGTKRHNNRKASAAFRWEKVSCHVTRKKKMKQENLIWGAINMIQCCVLWPATCHKPFPKIVRREAQTHTHTHTHTHMYAAEYENTLQRPTASIIVFLCLGICSDNMRSSHFIPHVKRHYSCCFTLIDSSFFHFISSQRVQGLQDFLQHYSGPEKRKEIKMNVCINNTALCEAFMNWKIKSKVSERKDLDQQLFIQWSWDHII